MNNEGHRTLLALVLSLQPSLKKEHLKELIDAIQFYSKTYDNFMLIGDYNAQVDEMASTGHLSVKYMS